MRKLHLHTVPVQQLIHFLYASQEMGIAMRARARIQINLAVSQVVDIKQVANFPDIVFPILWFEEVSTPYDLNTASRLSWHS